MNTSDNNVIKKPVVLDETVQALVDEIKLLSAREGAIKETLGEIKDILQEISLTNNKNTEIDTFLIPVPYSSVTITGTDELGKAKSASIALNDSITITQIQKAYDSGKMLFIDYTNETGGRNIIPLTGYTSFMTGDNSITSFTFSSGGFNNPLGRQFCIVSIKIITKPDGTSTLLCNCSTSGANAASITCDVTINNVKYTNVNAALAALAAI